MIGLSLSFCVIDIASGKVSEAEVDRIVANTCAYNDERIDMLIEGYKNTYWVDFPEADAIARRLFSADKVEQPRVDGKQHPGLELANYRNCWIK